MYILKHSLFNKSFTVILNIVLHLLCQTKNLGKNKYIKRILFMLKHIFMLFGSLYNFFVVQTISVTASFICFATLFLAHIHKVPYLIVIFVLPPPHPHPLFLAILGKARRCSINTVMIH